jgi:hypothetical protein
MTVTLSKRLDCSFINKQKNLQRKKFRVNPVSGTLDEPFVRLKGVKRNKNQNFFEIIKK